MESAASIIAHFGLEPHPEGGYFKETYRSAEHVPADGLPAAYGGPRSYSTGIYFLLTDDTFSAFHRVRQDEGWHFYLGAPITLHEIDTAGNYSKTVIGNDFRKGEVPQYVVKGGNWFGATLNAGSGFALVGCTVAPGFDFADFELARCSALVALYPQHEEIIAKLTRD